MATVTIERAKNAAGAKINGAVRMKNGTVLGTITADVTLTGPAGSILVWNSTAVAITQDTAQNEDLSFDAAFTVPANTDATTQGFALIPSTIDIEKTYYTALGLIFITSLDEGVDDATGSVTLDSDHAGLVETSGSQLADGSVPPAKLHGSHPVRGHFAGGSFVLGPSAGIANSAQFIVSGNPGDVFEFVTDDGSGDAGTTLGGQDGGYVINAINSRFESRNAIAYWLPAAFVGNVSGYSYAAAFPGGTPSRSMLAFCRLFPGSSGPGTYIAGGGALGIGTYSLRYAYYRNITLQYMHNGVLTTWAQIQETPQSTPLDVSVPAANGAVQFAVPPVPPGWDGLRVYAGWPLGPFSTGVAYQQAPPGASPGTSVAYTASATGLVIDSANKGITWSSGNATITFSRWGTLGTLPFASHGFSAWPSGVLLDKDPVAARYYLMKLGHATKNADSPGFYSVSGFHDQAHANRTNALGMGAVRSGHLATSNNYQTGYALGQDAGGSLAWVPSSAGTPAGGDYMLEDYSIGIVVSGFSSMTTSGLTVQIFPGGTAYTGGRYTTTGMSAPMPLTATSDNYIDWVGATNSWIITAVAVGAAAPTRANGAIRLYKLTTNATVVTATQKLYGSIPWGYSLLIGSITFTIPVSAVPSYQAQFFTIPSGLFGSTPHCWADKRFPSPGGAVTDIGCRVPTQNADGSWAMTMDINSTNPAPNTIQTVTVDIYGFA